MVICGIKTKNIFRNFLGYLHIVLKLPQTSTTFNQSEIQLSCKMSRYY